MSTCNNEQACVYIVPWADCNKCYAGQSDRLLSKRLGQYKDAVRLCHSYNSVFKHTMCDANHAINWGNI